MFDYVLQMKNIEKSFYGNKVLDDVGFDLKRGHVHALVGGNGAGKSTLMKILTGIYEKDAGTVNIEGQDVHFKDYGEANAVGIRMIFQELSVIPTMTVVENIYLNHEEKKGILNNDARMKKDAEDLLDNFGINIPVNEKVSSLSVGYCQLVEIAKALSKEVKILVMDEPTASLSDSEVKLLFDIVHKLKEKGVSIVYISHRMNEILEIANEVTVLRDGKHVVTEEAANLTVPAIVNYMLGDVKKRDFEYHERPHPENPGDLLTVENLCVDDLVDNVSFSVKEGEIVGLAGLMGSGRTEILEALFGIRKIAAGRVRISGKEVKIKNAHSAIKAGLALVPEDRRREGLVLMHTVKENMQIALFDKTKKGPFLDERKTVELTEQSVRELNIKTASIDLPISRLSGGNQQKVVIAKWLKNEPNLLLLDEPTAGIDIGAKGEIIEIVESFAEKGNGVLIVSSEISELMAMCDRIIVMFDGKVVGELTQEEIGSEEVIQNAIQG